MCEQTGSLFLLVKKTCSQNHWIATAYRLPGSGEKAQKRSCTHPTRTRDATLTAGCACGPTSILHNKSMALLLCAVDCAVLYAHYAMMYLIHNMVPGMIYRVTAERTFFLFPFLFPSMSLARLDAVSPPDFSPSPSPSTPGGTKCAYVSTSKSPPLLTRWWQSDDN